MPIESTDLFGDVVNNPSHYQARDGSGLECIDCIKAALDMDQFEGYLKGNVIKYIFRAGRKKDSAWATDLRKAQWYANRLCEHILDVGSDE